MIPLEKLRAIKHIVTHIVCPDGMATAMILKDVLPDAKVTFLAYDSMDHKMLNPEPGMLFCDFAPFTGRAQEFVDAGAIVLDHHKTQKDVVAQFGENGIFADEKAEPGVCGASLAYREVWKPLAEAHNADDSEPKRESISRRAFEAVEEFARLAGIRDTWQRTDPDWDRACAQAEAVLFWPPESLYIEPELWAEKLEIGAVLYENKLRSARHCLSSGYVIHTPKGRKILIFDGLRPTSDACDVDDGEHDLIVGFGYTTEERKFTKIIFSTRSKRFDCGAFCRAHGGGGHTGAAGFSQQISLNEVQPYEMFRLLFTAYEAVEEEWLKVFAEGMMHNERILTRGGVVEQATKFVPEVAYAKLLGKNDRPSEHFILNLDRYKRDNLLSLFRVMGYPAPIPSIEPFGLLHTGDWVGQLSSQLEDHKGFGEHNFSTLDEDELREQVQNWVDKRIEEADESDEDMVTIRMAVETAGKIGLFTFLKNAGYAVAGELAEELESGDVLTPDNIE